MAALNSFQCKKGDKDQESIQSNTTPDPGYHMGKSQKDKETYKKNKSQEVSPFPAGDHKAAMNRRESMNTQDINNTHDPQKKYRLGTVSKIFNWRA